MRLLDRYLLRELLIPFGYCLSGFLIFWISFDLFTSIEGFQRAALTWQEILRYYLLRTPEMLVTVVLPTSFLLSLLYALTNHARHHELTAIRAAGVSFWRMVLPYLAVGMFLSLAYFCMNELLVPQTTAAADALLTSRHKTKAADRQWVKQLGFTNTRQNRKWLIAAYYLPGQIMFLPLVEWTLTTGTRVDISAEQAFYNGQNWVFTNAQQRIFPPLRGEFPLFTETNLLVVPEFTETPQQIESEIKISKMEGLRDARRTQLSLREIVAYKRLHAESSAKLETKLHGRLAAPWTCLVVVLIALPFGAVSGRRNVFVGVASSILICFAYFVLLQLALALGVSGFAPPWLAAWTPNVAFGAAGVFLTRGIK